MSAHLCSTTLEDLNVPTSVCTGTRQSDSFHTHRTTSHYNKPFSHSLDTGSNFKPGFLTLCRQ